MKNYQKIPAGIRLLVLVDSHIRVGRSRQSRLQPRLKEGFFFLTPDQVFQKFEGVLGDLTPVDGSGPWCSFGLLRDGQALLQGGVTVISCGSSFVALLLPEAGCDRRADRLRQERRYGVADLLVLFGQRSMKGYPVWKCLDSCSFAHAQHSVLRRMDKGTPMWIALSEYCATDAIWIESPISLCVV